MAFYKQALTRAVRAAGVVTSDWLLAEQRRAGLALAQGLPSPAGTLAAGVHIPHLPPRKQLSPGGHAHRGVRWVPSEGRGGERYGRVWCGGDGVREGGRWSQLR